MRPKPLRSPDTAAPERSVEIARAVQTARLEFAGVALDPGDTAQVEATAAVELEASRRDPYRQLSRVFHLVGRRRGA